MVVLKRRPFGDTLELLDARFGRDAHDSMVRRIQQFHRIRRHGREEMRTFMGRFGRQF